MKTELRKIFIVLYLAQFLINVKMTQAQVKVPPLDTVVTSNTRMANSLDAEIYYSNNIGSGLGRIGGLTANIEGPSLFSLNNRVINFAPNQGDWWDYSFTMTKGRHGDPTFFTPRSAWLRMGGPRGLALWGNGRQSLDDEPAIFVTGSNKVEVGVVRKLSQSNHNNYSLFVTLGILSEKYGLGSQESWSDHVFDNNYQLRSLPEVENFIRENKHLPNIPDATEIRKNGYDLHDMNVKFLEKIEELTLYIIDQDKEIKQLKKELETFNEIAEKVTKLEDTLSR